MIRADCLSLPLGETIFKNAQFLRLYVDIHAFSADKPDPYSVASFLSHVPEKNAYMAQIPQRYSFSEEERQTYFSDPLRWTIDYDLRDQIGEALFDLFGDRERAERLMRKMYCSGHILQPSAKIKEGIAALLSLHPDPKELRELVEENWMFLFTFYKDTAKTISILSDIFLNEYVWTVFSKECVWLTGGGARCRK